MTVAILFPRCCLPEKVSTFRDISDWLPKLSLKEQRKISNEIKTKAPCRAIYLSSVSFSSSGHWFSTRSFQIMQNLIRI